MNQKPAATVHMNPKRNEYIASGIGPFAWSDGLALLLVLGASILAFVSLSNGLPGDFILDDHARVKHADVETISPGDIFGSILETDSGTFGRILPLASLYITKALYGAEAEIFKFHNILFHLIAGLTVFWFVGRLFSSGQFKQAAPVRNAWLFAAIVCALWLLHPIQVSTALYIVQRMTQFSLIFTLLTLICYLNFRQGLADDDRKAILPFLGMIAFMMAGLLSKETTALVPFYILLIEYFVFRFQLPSINTRLPYYAFLILICFAPIAAGLLYFATHLDTLLHDYVMRSFSASDRIASEAVIMWRYIGMLLIPRLSEFTLYHDGISINTLFSFKSLLALVAWLASIAALIRYRKDAAIFTFGISFFLVSHLLESTVLPLELMFEHRNYIGSMGIFIALSSALLRIPRFFPTLRNLGVITLAALIIGFSIMQMARANDWSDPYVQALLSAKEHPESARALSTLANYQAQRGHLEEAQGLIRTAIENRSHDGFLPGLYLHLVMFHCLDEDLSNDLLDNAANAIEQNPIDSYALTGLKVLRLRMLDGDCPAISRPVLLLLESAAAANDRTRLAYRFFFNGMAGISSAELTHYSAARAYLQTALKFSDHVSQVTHRDTLVALSQVCIAEGNRACADEALAKTRHIDSLLEPVIGSHDLLPTLEQSYRKEFVDKNSTEEARREN